MNRSAVAAGVGSFGLVFALVFLVEGVILSTPLWTTVPVATIVAVAAGLLTFYQMRRSDRSR